MVQHATDGLAGVEVQQILAEREYSTKNVAVVDERVWEVQSRTVEAQLAVTEEIGEVRKDREGRVMMVLLLRLLRLEDFVPVSFPPPSVIVLVCLSEDRKPL